MMNDARDYISYEGGKIFYINKTPEMYKDKIILLYGETGSGKSTILMEILHLLKDKVSMPFVFSPTNFANHDFDGIVPPDHIYNYVDVKKLEDIWDMQEDRSVKYRQAKDLEILKSLFDRISTSHEKKQAEQIIYITRHALDELKYNNKIGINVQKMEKLNIEKQRNKSISRLFKKTIKKSRSRLESMDLDDDEIIALNFLDFNPHIILVFDDCMSSSKDWGKQEVIKKLFFTGRKYFITQIYTLQDDHGIPPDLRKNGMFSIFTSSNLAGIFFDTTSNGITTHDKKEAKKIINVVFKETHGQPDHYRKLVFDKTKANKFMCIIADLYEDFKVGSSYIWKFADKLPRKDGYIVKRKSKMDFLY